MINLCLLLEGHPSFGFSSYFFDSCFIEVIYLFKILGFICSIFIYFYLFLFDFLFFIFFLVVILEFPLFLIFVLFFCVLFLFYWFIIKVYSDINCC